ncbi:MAG: 2-amino-4-hydroxy-6-hydroxymethyldihydropteridine diphosphokinase [Krumholzibacteria bacterium]|nr:2-amino-4-hydroxy-6-hydroxymethyldihydropteridine diphosphokinase [Candidatus Krumholzibacteria bacterium]
MSVHAVHLTLGSNVEAARNYPAAVRLLRGLGEVVAVSPVYETQPVGMRGAANFLNGAVLLRTELAPVVLKTRLRLDVEQALGRERPADGAWAPRTIDVDIALWGDLVGEILGRRVPDPDIVRHLHVARPLADLSPDLVHPEDGRPLAQIAADLRAAACVPPVPRPDITLAP